MDYMDFDQNALYELLKNTSKCETTKCETQKNNYEQCLKQGHTNCRKWLLTYYKCLKKQ